MRARPPCGRLRSILPPALLACAALTSCARQAAPPAVAYESHLAAGGIGPAGGVWRNPHDGDPAVARNGALLFKAMNCDGCHGAGAAGWVGPNLGDGRWRYGGADAEIFNSIYYGRSRG
ncbi:MAG: c-type cytochrome, partial [Steroidobacteraceae bacterium]